MRNGSALRGVLCGTALSMVIGLALHPCNAATTAAPPAPPPVAAPSPVGNFLIVHQYPVGTVNYVYNPQQHSITREIMTAWMITRGRWDGQTLDGLSAVVLQDVPEDVTPTRSDTVLVSLHASKNQRMALLHALKQSRPDLFHRVAPRAVHVRPAFIRFERLQSGQMVLRIGRIA